MAGASAGYPQPSSLVYSLTALFLYALEKGVEARTGTRRLGQAAGLCC